VFAAFAAAGGTAAVLAAAWAAAEFVFGTAAAETGPAPWALAEAGATAEAE